VGATSSHRRSAPARAPATIRDGGVARNWPSGHGSKRGAAHSKAHSIPHSMVASVGRGKGYNVAGDHRGGRRNRSAFGFVATGLGEGCGQVLRARTRALNTPVDTGADCGHKGHAGELDRGGGSTGASGASYGLQRGAAG
jgi:hypothetical protein